MGSKEARKWPIVSEAQKHIFAQGEGDGNVSERKEMLGLGAREKNRVILRTWGFSLAKGGLKSFAKGGERARKNAKRTVSLPCWLSRRRRSRRKCKKKISLLQEGEGEVR